MNSKPIQEDLIALRKSLHQHPEIAGEEMATASSIITYLESFGPDRIVQHIGGYGFVAEFKGKNDGPSVMFRCELDALPIQENNLLDYQSVYSGKAHLCGHDGHMAMVAGLASHLKKNPPLKGRVLLLFQPSEEDGQGAQRILKDPKFKDFIPDYIFAIHNLPGYPLHRVILSKQNFAAASRGLAITLIGKSSHAAEPEMGINPAIGMSKMLLKFDELIKERDLFKDFVLITPIHTRLGNIAYGTSPGEGEIHLTLRSYLDRDMDLLIQKTEHIIHGMACQEGLKTEISYTEIFPATKNNIECIRFVDKACNENELVSEYLAKPFRWSEDFGHFTAKFPGALFGLGSGKDQPALHNPDFDFPDDLIVTGITLYKSIYENILDV